MSVGKAIYFLSILCISHVVGAAEAPIANRWDPKAQREGITALQRKAYQQVAKLHNFKGWQMAEWGTVDYEFGVPAPNPMTTLRDMDIDVLPILVEALDDSTPTKTVNKLGTNIAHKPGWKPNVHVWKVNELVARLIRDITHHEFVLGELRSEVNLLNIEAHRDRIPEFQKQILEWYEQNKDKKPEERKIADLKSNLRSRLDAEIWLGKKKSIKAVPFLAKQIETVLEQRESSLTETELAEISLALGRIGDPKGLPAVKKACDHLSYWLPRSPGSSATQELFTAYHGLALLGQKKEAMAELNRIYGEFRPKMEPLRKKEFEERLGEAAKW